MNLPITQNKLEEFIQENNLTQEEFESLRSFVEAGSFNHNKEVVGVREFVESPYYLNTKGSLYPPVLDALEEICTGKYVEAVLTGGIGSAKTTIAVYCQAYYLYVLSCMENPHKEFGLDPSSEILIIFQSINKDLSKEVDYARFKSLVEHSPYFQKYFMFNADIKSELQFPNRIKVKPVSGLETAAIGQNVIGGVIDEINYMAVTEKSKQAIDKGTYDQAVSLYNSIARRRKSRFLLNGRLPGMLCLVSSKRYPGQFTDMKELEAKDDPSIYIYDKRVWDIKPDSFCGDTFPVFIGTDVALPKMIDHEDELLKYEESQIVQVPIEYKAEFRSDLVNSLREIAGVSIIATHPFITDSEAVTDVMKDGISVCNLDTVDFDHYIPTYDMARMMNVKEPRYCHIDLALTGDSAGIAIGHVTGFSEIKRNGEAEESHIERLPKVRIDMVLEVCPPKQGEILIYKIRNILYQLRDMGMPIRWVSFDGFQSADSMQLLRSKGFITGYVSVDKTTKPYGILKNSIYDGRLVCPHHQKLVRELVNLEYDAKKDKIDHPTSGSKDLADALAGVVWGLHVRREPYIRWGIPMVNVPQLGARI